MTAPACLISALLTRAGITIDFLQTAQSTAGGTSVTFAAQNLGAAASDRKILITVSAEADAAGTPTVSALSVQGIAATLVATGAGADGRASVYIVNVPSGSTGDIALTFSTAYGRLVVGVYRITGLLSSTAFHTASAINNDPLTAAINVKSGGFAVAVMAGGGGGSVAWTGLTEDFDIALGALSEHSGASKKFLADQTGLSVSADLSSADLTGGLAIASFGNQ